MIVIQVYNHSHVKVKSIWTFWIVTIISKCIINIKCLIYFHVHLTEHYNITLDHVEPRDLIQPFRVYSEKRNEKCVS